MNDRLKEEREQLRAQNNAQSWRDCEAAGLRHRWRLSHVVEGTTSHYWECGRTACPVNVRTTTPARPEPSGRVK